MIELFHTRPMATPAQLSVPQWDYVLRQNALKFQGLEAYYRRAPRPVNNNHILARLIGALPLTQNLSDERYLANVQNLSPSHARMLGLVNEISFGQIFKGGLMSAGAPEIIIATEDSINLNELRNDWAQAVPLKAVWHNRMDSRYELPNGTNYAYNNQVVNIWQLDVPLLMMQHRLWWQDQQARPAGERHTTEQFIGGYVLPNALRSIADIAFFNRLRFDSGFYDHRFDGYARNTPHPVFFPGAEETLTSASKQVISNLKVSKLSFDTILKSLPSFSHDDLYESLMLPDMAPTRQIDWVFMLARVPVYLWLCQMAGAEVKAKNQPSINQVVRAFRRNDTLDLFRQLLPQGAALYVTHQVQQILRLTQSEL